MSSLWGTPGGSFAPAEDSKHKPSQSRLSVQVLVSPCRTVDSTCRSLTQPCQPPKLEVCFDSGGAEDEEVNEVW